MTTEPGGASGVQPVLLEDLTPQQRDRVRMRVAHLLEVETGFRSGDPLNAAAGEPRPVYDPAVTTLRDRRRAKVAELQALGGEEARLLGLDRISERTLQRLATAYWEFGAIGCVDGRWVRRSGGHPSVSIEVREAIHAVRQDCQRRAKVSMRTKYRLVHQYVRETFGPDVAVCGYDTLRRVWAEWFGPGGARQRYARTAETNTLPAHHVKIHGQRGVKIRGLWYDGPGLEDYRHGSSARGGVHKGLWVVRRGPRDRRFVYFQDPTDPQTWHTLRWVGLPPDGDVPSFGDARVMDLLAAAREHGLAPRSDTDLLPVLLELLGGHIPVTQWPTQLSRKQRIDHARETLQGEATAADRPTPPPPAKGGTDTPPAASGIDTPEKVERTTDSAGARVVPLHGDRARTARDAVDHERRRRRETAIGDRQPTPPPRLGEGVRQHSLLAAVTRGEAASGSPERL